MTVNTEQSAKKLRGARRSKGVTICPRGRSCAERPSACSVSLVRYRGDIGFETLLRREGEGRTKRRKQCMSWQKTAAAEQPVQEYWGAQVLLCNPSEL
jgi:hypothetical protein